MSEILDLKVWRRARGRCGYCRVPAEHYRTPFQIDHIIARQHGGETKLSNLALSCFRCNIHKGPNIAGIDWKTRKMAALFNPRLNRWEDHFVWRGARLVGQTAIGRATMAVLDINHPDYLAVRRSIIAEKLFPR